MKPGPDPVTAALVDQVARVLVDELDGPALTAARAALDRGEVEVARDRDGTIRVRIGGPAGMVVRTHVLSLLPQRQTPGLN